MIRSQIYLTEDERNSSKLIAEETGRTQNILIREAIDSRINKKRQKAFGIWEVSSDYPKIEELRNEFDRTL